jgi:hypothetical protein
MLTQPDPDDTTPTTQRGYLARIVDHALALRPTRAPVPESLAVGRAIEVGPAFVCGAQEGLGRLQADGATGLRGRITGFAYDLSDACVETHSGDWWIPVTRIRTLTPSGPTPSPNDRRFA